VLLKGGILGGRRWRWRGRLRGGGGAGCETLKGVVELGQDGRAALAFGTLLWYGEIVWSFDTIGP